MSEEIKDLIKLPVHFDEYGATHFFDADNNMIAMLRGWGKLQYEIIDGKKVYNEQLGIDRMVKIGEFIAAAINDYHADKARISELERENFAQSDLIDRLQEREKALTVLARTLGENE